MKILAIDTSTEACSVALAESGRLLERHSVPGRGHADRILGDVDSLLAEAGWKPSDLDLVACGCGPGSFTGVRIGVSTAQAIAFGADVRTLGVSTLRVLAQGVDTKQMIAALDARMGQIYVGAYARDAAGIMQTVKEVEVCAPDAFAAPVSDEPWAGAGHGFGTYEAELGPLVDGFDASALPRARDLVRIAEVSADTATDPVFLAPQYVRNNVAKVKGEQ